MVDLDPADLVIRGLHAGYADLPVLRDIDLVVPSGSIVALLGPNGAGKSTLLRSIFGQATVRRGSITYGGERIDGRAPYEVARKGICFVTDERTIFPTLSVRDNLELFARCALDDAARRTVFDQFPVLEERQSQLAGTMSGGEQQMLALSRALLGHQRLIMADELSMGLSPIAVDSIFDVVGGFRHRGSTVLMVEQFVDRALALADVVYVMWRGHIVFAGEPSELADAEMLMRLYQTGEAGPSSSRRSAPRQGR